MELVLPDAFGAFFDLGANFGGKPKYFSFLRGGGGACYSSRLHIRAFRSSLDGAAFPTLCLINASRRERIRTSYIKIAVIHIYTENTRDLMYGDHHTPETPAFDGYFGVMSRTLT